MSISELVLKKDVANILKKLQRGKTLTASERACIREYESASKNEASAASTPQATTARTIIELARILGVSRRIISTWRKKFPDAPKPRANGLHDVPKWRAFVSAHELAAPGFEEDAPENELLRMRKLKAEAELAEIRVATAKGKFVSVKRVEEVWHTHIGQVRKTLENRFLNELPPILSAIEDAIEIRQRLQDVIDECCATLKGSSEQMKTSGDEDK